MTSSSSRSGSNSSTTCKVSSPSTAVRISQSKSLRVGLEQLDVLEVVVGDQDFGRSLGLIQVESPQSPERNCRMRAALASRRLALVAPADAFASASRSSGRAR